MSQLHEHDQEWLVAALGFRCYVLQHVHACSRDSVRLMLLNIAQVLLVRGAFVVAMDALV
jgi:hypothetical protein